MTWPEPDGATIPVAGFDLASYKPSMTYTVIKTVEDFLMVFDLPKTKGGKYDFIVDTLRRGYISRNLAIEILNSIPYIDIDDGEK